MVDAGSERAEAAIAEFIGQWNHLVSMTNWEKGKIIFLWRRTLQSGGAQSSEYSDEVWSRRVGSVSPQHVGRLRRVYERFGTIQAEEPYSRLYWSHFQAAVEWLDAEKWLTSSAENGWSVQTMRQQRWEALGLPPDQRPDERDMVVEEHDADTTLPEFRGDPTTDNDPGRSGEKTSVIHGHDDDDESDGDGKHGRKEVGVAGDDCPFDTDAGGGAHGGSAGGEPGSGGSGRVRPFENLPALPEDLREATELFKLAILAHKMTGWTECPAATVLKTLDALKTLTLATPDG